MFNVTVIKGNDILKYVIKLMIVIIILYIFRRVLYMSLSQNKIQVSRIINENKLTKCLEENISILNQSKENKEEFIKNVEGINPLKIIFKGELNISSYIRKKDINTEVANESKKENEKQNKQEQGDIKHAETGVTTQVIANNVPNKFTNSYHGVQIKNGTDYNLTEEMLTPDITVNNENVLIFHTHTCESYTPSEKFDYQQTGTFRTTDLNYSVVRVGTELTKQLISYNYKVIHDTTYHDWPAYSGSYGRSLETVKNILKENQSTDVVIDLHRDAIGDYSYAPTVKIGEEEASQLMFVIGTDGGGLEHPNWNQNLKFAIKLQEKANELYPGLFKPIILRNSRYNQHLAKGACIIEVGATGNTMDQCLNSMKYLAKVMSEVMK